MRITLSSVLVEDQAKALNFYTDVLGFVKCKDQPAGADRWLTVISPEASPEIQLVLEPTSHPAARVYQQALHADGIPVTSFASADLEREYERLLKRGVVFKMKPTRIGPVQVAIFDDTCGNFVQLHQD